MKIQPPNVIQQQNMNCGQFRSFVDAFAEKVSPYKSDPTELSAYVGLQTQGSYRREDVFSALRDKIFSSFSGSTEKIWRDCKRLESDFIRAHVILDKPMDPYLNVLEIIRDALGGEQHTKSQTDDDWSTALQAALDIIELEKPRQVSSRNYVSREFSVAREARFLKDQGYEITLESGFIAIEISSEERLARKIEGIISSLGGLNVIKKLFEEIHPKYDSDLTRYHLVPPVSLLGGSSPLVPWGYILNLSIKNIDGQKPYASVEDYWLLLKRLTKAYAAVIDVQKYTPYETMFAAPHKIIEFLQEQALFNGLFGFQQIRPEDVSRLCRGALSFCDFESLADRGWSISQALKIVDFLNTPSLGEVGPITISLKQVCYALSDISPAVIKSLLDDVFSHPRGANAEYLLPSTAANESGPSNSAPDFYLKPLLKRRGNRYLIVNQSICGWGYYEALLASLRKEFNNIDDLVGKSIEEFLEKEFLAKKIESVSGDYSVNKESGECDLVVSTNERLFFFELKKKAMTRKAQVGSDRALLFDISAGALESQKQAIRHERILRENGMLKLSKNGSQGILRLEDRQIETISISLMDFGGFQSRDMFQNILNSIMGTRFNSIDIKDIRKMNKLNETIKSIENDVSKLRELTGDQFRPFFNSWFLSIPQIFVILDKSRNAEEFQKIMRNYKHFSTGTSDFYFEVYNQDKLKKGRITS